MEGRLCFVHLRCEDCIRTDANLDYSIPVTLSFEQATGKNVLLLPMGSSTDAAHSINEKLDKRNYIEGIKLLGAYLHYVAEEPMTT